MHAYVSGGLMPEELFQVYYSTCILPVPEDLALKQDNNKGFAVFHCKVHVTEEAPAPQRECNTMNILIILIITGKPCVYTKAYWSIHGYKRCRFQTSLAGSI